MTKQIRLSGGSAKWRRKTLRRCGLPVAFLTCTFTLSLSTECWAQNKSSSPPSDVYRFKVTDGDSDIPIPHAEISLAYLQKQGNGDVKKEMEGKTDQRGLAEFPKLDADKLAVSVTVKGYRSYWRWIRPEGSKGLIRIRLEKWASARK